MLKLLERMRKNNVPIDALGVQSHIGFSENHDDDAESAGTRETEWRRFLDEVVGMDLDLLVTEFDVNDKSLRRLRSARPGRCSAYAATLN